jgi:hypothetical protein
MTTQTHHLKLPILSFLCVSWRRTKLSAAKSRTRFGKRNEPKLTGPASHPERSVGSQCAKQSQISAFSIQNRRLQKNKPNNVGEASVLHFIEIAKRSQTGNTNHEKNKTNPICALFNRKSKVS